MGWKGMMTFMSLSVGCFQGIGFVQERAIYHCCRCFMGGFFSSGLSYVTQIIVHFTHSRAVYRYDTGTERVLGSVVWRRIFPLHLHTPLSFNVTVIRDQEAFRDCVDRDMDDLHILLRTACNTEDHAVLCCVVCLKHPIIPFECQIRYPPFSLSVSLELCFQI